MRKRLMSFALALALAVTAMADKLVSVHSPNGQVKVNITIGDKVYYDVESAGETLLQKSHLGMTLRNRTLGTNSKLKGKKQKTVNETLTPVFPLKYSQVENHYNQLTLSFDGDWQLEWRVYDDAVAYRFVTAMKGEIEVMKEDVTLCLPQPTPLVLQQTGSFRTSCEEPYSRVNSNEWKAEDYMSEVPLVIAGKGQKMLLSEYDLFDYPGMFFKGNANNTLTAIHPLCPLEFQDNGDRSQNFTKEADYIAKTTGTRTFPWRYLHITADDRHMAESTLPTRLAPKSEIEDTGWIKPGKTTWEWWNGSIPYGPDVNFKSGLNLDTYKYFVDFAAKHGLEYILMDEGWAKSTRDPFTPNPDIDLHELISYAKSKNVGIILWLTWLTVDKHMDLFKTFEQWGIKGVKIDFMDRQDQWMVKYYERVAREAAKHHLLVDYHGAYHPSGMQEKFPNIVSFEGVRGMEQMGGCRPENSVYLPFIRNAVGPMDYTPGAMLCAQPDCYASRRPNSASIGTRAYQMALYVQFESHLQMMADNPSLYNRWPDCTAFIAGMPVNWDETRVLKAELGQYIVTARRKGDKWYIGGITNGTLREFSLDLDFLSDGREYKLTQFSDGPNADTQAMDYRCSTIAGVRASYKLHIRMVRNGGYAAVLE